MLTAIGAHDYDDLFDENLSVYERNHFARPLLFPRDIINRQEHVFALMTTEMSKTERRVTHRAFP